MTHEERNTAKPVAVRPLEGKRRHKRVRGRKGKIPLRSYDRKMKRIGPPKQFMAGQKNIVVIWTMLRLLTHHTSQHGKSDQGMKTCLCIKSMMDHIPGECQIGRIFHQQLAQLVFPNTIPKNERDRQRPLDEKLRPDLEWQKLEMESKLVAGVIFIFNR